MDRQDGPLGLADQVEGPEAVALEVRLMGRFLAVGQSIEAVQVGGVAELLRQGAPRMLEDQIGGADQASGPADMAELGAAEVEGAKVSADPRGVVAKGVVIAGLRPKVLQVRRLRRRYYTLVVGKLQLLAGAVPLR